MITKLDFVGIPIAGPRAFADLLRRDARAAARRSFPLRGLGRRHVLRHLAARGDGDAVRAQKNAHPALHVEDIAATRAELEGKGVEFAGETFDTGVCHMALFTDPDGNDLMLHHRYAPR